MKRLRYFGAGLLALALATAIVVAAVPARLVAQVTAPIVASMGLTDLIQVIPAGNPAVGNVYGNRTLLKAWLQGGVSGHSGTPVLSSCGTSPVLATGSTDTSGRITTGTATPTGCVLTFATAYNAAPACVVVSQTAYATSTPSYVVAAGTITITQAAVNSVIYNYVCNGMTGG